ncbi:TPA: rRNA pseudouridine synthase [Candidatus Avigastranaerophilus faecigallinarum]|nr:rRNA pseudouridine synthase [Candidatus Avigastranaerophilus faecigallinarum]
MKNSKVRLNKYIAACGYCSRRKADEYIEAGKVRVNGEIVSELGFMVSTKDKITIENKIIKPETLTYIRYYKPAGYITTMDDEKGRKTIYDILPEEVQNLKPVGRLDKDSTGLLILTNDGDFINDLAHPSIKVPKVYRVTAQGKLNLNDLEIMAKGIEIEKDKIAYADSRIIDFEGKNTVLEIVLYQGLNRQIRKMLDYIGHPVISLKRLSMGPIDLQGLKKGQFKYLKPKQIQQVKNYLKKLSKDNKK